jgi:hypothetical protein
MLIIGVGGSGGKTLRSMKQAIERRLETARYQGGIPSCWQFLQIDTTYDGQEFPPPMLDPYEEFKSVIADGDDYQNIKNKLISRPTRNRCIEFSWKTIVRYYNYNMDFKNLVRYVLFL